MPEFYRIEDVVERLHKSRRWVQDFIADGIGGNPKHDALLCAPGSHRMPLPDPPGWANDDGAIL